MSDHNENQENNDYCDDFISVEEIKEISEQIVENISNLDSLEVFLKQDGVPDIHLAYKIEKSENISDFLKYLVFSNNPQQETQSLSCEYQNSKFIYNTHTIEEGGANSTSFILLSSGGIKKGMVILVDASGAIFIATCPVEFLRTLNYNLYKVLYP